MNQRQVFRGVGALVAVLMLSGCGFDIGKFDYTEPEFVGSYSAKDAATVVALADDRTFTASGVPDEVLAKAVDGDPSEIRGTWKYVSSSADHVRLTVTDADGKPTTSPVATSTKTTSSQASTKASGDGADGRSNGGKKGRDKPRPKVLALYVADADDLFFLPDRLGREKVMVTRSR